jgi:hypothetical protein
MKTNQPQRGHKFVLTFLFILSLFPVYNSVSATTHIGDQKITIADDIRFKRISDGSVVLTAVNESGQTQEYVFDEFQADVITMLYRKMDPEIMISNLSKKYVLSKTDTRRNLKMTINTLEEFKLVKREYGTL